MKECLKNCKWKIPYEEKKKLLGKDGLLIDPCTNCIRFPLLDDYYEKR